jgi:hypothetical protein
MTSSIEEFIGVLGPADVLLFDSMRPVSHIIKLAENRPVNHAGLYAGSGEFLHATVHEPGEPTVTSVPLDRRLRSGSHRTVTALRHLDVLQGQLDGPGVVDRARDMAEAGGQYALVDLMSLVIPTVWRSYHQDLKRTPEARRAIEYLSTNLLADMERAAAQQSTQLQVDHPETLTVTCSEMVYLAFDRTIRGCFQIEDPLARWSTEPSTVDESATPDEADPRLIFYPPVPPVPTPAGPNAPGQGGGLKPSDEDLVALFRRAILTITGQAARNRRHGKYGDHGAPHGAPLADCVTPGDLWASPSLSCVAVFHLPPPWEQPSDASESRSS